MTAVKVVDTQVSVFLGKKRAFVEVQGHFFGLIVKISTCNVINDNCQKVKQLKFRRF